MKAIDIKEVQPAGRIKTYRDLLVWQKANQFELINESGREIERMLSSLIRNLKK